MHMSHKVAFASVSRSDDLEAWRKSNMDGWGLTETGLQII